ncbi:Aspartic-type endopeptidase ctsD [Penicillium argentinense]|uniref:penicillopepsin n=1 Tax=Penicillium argentinense TaxID=1131581 RepID=A0A9W9FF89_9EURO|nr:Aspartic-type endopeptidase ctsD [Penicillium argentinense]KAJ5099084.1 Aspartic-type endopeptidase ctsD [Penicillium argentinense]
MRLSPCLVVAGLSTSVHAFYPWELKIATGASISSRQTGFRRFMPWSLIPEESEEEETAPLTLDIKKFRRDYSIVESETPTLKNSAALDQDGKDFSYFSVVKVGSQQQEMWLALDTGSPSSWVFSSKCISDTCKSHHTFDSSTSDTYYSNSSTFSLGYGSGQIQGDLGQDTMSLADLDVTLSFGFATSATKAFNSYPIDGILGLGRSYTNGWEIPSFMDKVAEKGLISSNLVGFSLSRANDNNKDGEVNFGTVDTTKYDGDITYTTTNADTWTIPMDDAYVNGVPCNLIGKSAIIDTGTTYILIPPSDAATLFGLIPGSSQSGENYMIPCDSTATVEFEFSNVKYSIEPEDYIGSETDGGCISTIVGHQSSGPNTWLVGDVFLKNVYSVFDFDNGQIGFGTKASNSSSGNGTFTAPAVTAAGTIASAASTDAAAASAAENSATSTATSGPVATINSATRFSNGLALSLIMTFAAALIL